jgi:branched-chain amino acid transport system permease protein
MTSILQDVIDGLTAGSFYALFALGITLIFGIMRLVNFAQGELIMAGAYSVYMTQSWPWPLTVLTAIAVVVVLALLTERIAFRPVRGRSPATLLITSFAVSFFLQNLARMVFTTLPKSADITPLFLESFDVGGLTISWLSVVTMATTAALMVALALFMNRTRLGVHLRAAAEDFGMARLCGVRANGVVALAFAISGVLAAVGAVLLVGQTGSLTVTMGLTPVLFGFTAAAVGGLGSLVGAVLGGYLLGGATVVLQNVLPYELGGYRDALLFAAVFALMALRPGGLLRAAGLTERV